MAEGREAALRAALWVMAGREIDTPDLLAIAEWLRSGRHPYDGDGHVDQSVEATAELQDKLKRARCDQAPHEEAAAENERLHVVKSKLDSYMGVWRRIEKLVGREFTSPESVIDRMAWLVEQAARVEKLEQEAEAHREEAVAENERLRKDAEHKLALSAKRELEVTELRKRVKDVLDNDGDLLDEARRTRLARAYRWTETPAEAAARLRVE